jgi:hypothetical protein
MLSVIMLNVVMLNDMATAESDKHSKASLQFYLIKENGEREEEGDHT